MMQQVKFACVAVACVYSNKVNTLKKRDTLKNKGMFFLCVHIVTMYNRHE